MMEQIIDKKKEKLFLNIRLCLKKLSTLNGGESLSYTVMPILYILVAHHHGKRFEIESPDFFKDHFLQMPLEMELNKQSEELLYGIARFFPNLIRPEISHCVANFYEENSYLFDAYYKEIVDYILALVVEQGGRSSSEYTTPSYLTQLFSKIIATKKPNGVYDPCAGMCSIVTIPEMARFYFEGQEINEMTQLFASIRLDAYNRPLTIRNEDALSNWNHDTNCDLLFSDLPFGMRVNVPYKYGVKQSFIEDEIITKFIETPNLQKAILVVGLSTCYRSINLSLRKTLCENNYVEMVIELPNSVLAHSGIKPIILVLNKGKKDNNIKFISATDCLIKEAPSKKSLNIETIMGRISGKNKSQVKICDILETRSKDYNLAPYQYIQEDIQVLPGQKVLPLKQIASIIRGTRSYTENEGRILDPNSFCQTLADYHLQEPKFQVKAVSPKDHYVKIEGRCVIFDRMMNRFFIKNDEEPLFIKSIVFYAFEVDETKCSQEYFTMLLLNSQMLRSLKSDMVVHHFSTKDLNNLLLSLFEDQDSQRNLVERSYREVERELKAKLDKIQILSGKSSDLLHNLGTTFTRMGAAVACIEDIIERDDDDMIDIAAPRYLLASPEKDNMQDSENINSYVSSLDANIKFALRQLNSTGADFATVIPDLEIEDIEKVVEEYMESWNYFGYGTFELLPLESSLSTTEPTMVKVDKSLLYTALDCILTNAHQHGFNRMARDNNQVSIELKPVSMNTQPLYPICADEEKYVLISVSNNGHPLPEGFTLKDFISRGVVGINSSQDGLGGDHICKIAHLFDGRVSIESSDKWLSFNMLLPIYVSPKDTKFNEYECESI